MLKRVISGLHSGVYRHTFAEWANRSQNISLSLLSGYTAESSSLRGRKGIALQQQRMHRRKRVLNMYHSVDVNCGARLLSL
jgi:hypothetical protein